MERITREWVRRQLPRRRSDGHKGTFGKVYVLGGAVGYTGAPVYAAEAAVRSGAGLVYAGVPGEVYPIVAARCAAAMARPIPRTYKELLAEMAGCDVWVVGPGLGRAARTERPGLLLKRKTFPCA